MVLSRYGDRQPKYNLLKETTNNDTTKYKRQNKITAEKEKMMTKRNNKDHVATK